VEGRRLTAWAMARPRETLKHEERIWNCWHNYWADI
jgi:hypothetical protein